MSHTQLTARQNLEAIITRSKSVEFRHFDEELVTGVTTNGHIVMLTRCNCPAHQNKTGTHALVTPNGHKITVCKHIVAFAKVRGYRNLKELALGIDGTVKAVKSNKTVLPFILYVDVNRQLVVIDTDTKDYWQTKSVLEFAQQFFGKYELSVNEHYHDLKINCANKTETIRFGQLFQQYLKGAGQTGNSAQVWR